MKMFRCLIAAIAAGMILTSSASSQVTVIYWDTNGAVAGSGNAGGDWDNNAYWSTDAAGTTATSTFSALWNQDLGFDDVVFSAGADGTGTWTVTSQHHRVAPNLTVEEGHVTLTGSNTLGVRSNGTWSAVTGASLTSERGIAFLNNAVLSFFSSTKNGGAITANGVISGAGSIVVKGPGTLTLGNANNFNGTTTIDGGTLVLGHPGAIGMATSGAKGFTLRSGTLDVNGQIGAYGNTWALGLGTTITLGGMAGATMEIKDSSTAQTGFGHYHNYQDSNPASCMVYDATNNPGMATISAKSFQTVGVSANTIRRITVGYSTATDVELEFSGTMLITGASDGHNATLLKDGAGAMRISAANNFPKVTIAEGTLIANHAQALGTSRTGTGGSANIVTLAGGTLQAAGEDRSYNAAVVLATGSTSTVNGDEVDLILSGIVSGDGNLIKAGTKSLTLAGPNTYNGTTTIEGGTLVLGHPGAIGMATSGAKGFTLRSGTLDVNGQVGAYGNTWALGLGTTITLGGMAGATMEIKDSSTAQTGFGHYHNYQDSNPASCMIYDATGNPGMATISAKSFQTVGTSGNTIRRITVGYSTETDVELDFTGTMLITGASDGHNATLLKDGAGAMRISAANNFPKVTIAEGTLIANHAQALGTSRTGTAGSANIVTLAGGTLQAAGEDRSYSAAVVLADNTTSTIGGNDASLTLSGTVSGNGNLIKAGTAVLTLSSPGNSFNGTATVEGGLLNVTGGLANNGPSHILIHSAGTTFGSNDPRIARTVPSGFDLSGTSVGSTIIGGDHGTTAELLDGIAGADRTVTMAWRQGTTDEKTLDGGGLISDVLNLEGTESDTYVLQMSYSPDALASIWGESALAESICLAWLDGGVWKNAVAGNTGGTATFVEAAYDPLQHFELGNYGVDATNNVAWAVLNHASQFAVVVPEPGTLVLLAAALASMLACRHRKRR